MSYNAILKNIIQSAKFSFSTISPSEWAEQNRVMNTAESQLPGKYSYDYTPYLREIVDCMHYSHPARVVAVMKGAQIGFTTGVIEPAIGWIISENPANTLFLTGHADLSKEAMERIDGMIDGSGIRHLIKASAQRARKTKSGDTDNMKQFAGGSLIAGSANNHKLLRQRSVKNIFIDDFDAAKNADKDSGSTRKMIEQRSAAYSSQRKNFYISTPETKPSNIEEVFLLGDQRYYHIQCPCCSEYIKLQWEIEMETGNGMAGMVWKLDEEGRLIDESVKYKCYKCGGEFSDENKTDLLANGKWIPTAKPSQEGYYSYHISALYAPIGMFDWEHYVRDYLEANPINQPPNPELNKTFQNLCLGLSFEPDVEEIKASELQRNIRGYQIGTIPEKQSIEDGNGKIVLLTMGSDLNGKLNDARLDYEVVAYSENGASYSITHGSIGTFVPREIKMTDRKRYTYQHGMDLSVWREFDEIVNTTFVTDTGREMKILLTALDIGYQTVHAYQYIDNCNGFVVGIKGVDNDKFTANSKDTKIFKHSQERNNLYLLQTNIAKDRLAEYIRLKWDSNFSDTQPSGFMNFPTPSNGKYLFNNFFEHFEAEHKILSKDGYFRWKKKNDMVQNHLYDCRIYANACKNIVTDLICKEYKVKNGTWSDFVTIVLPNIE